MSDASAFNFKWEDVERTIELRGVYDGWSAVVMKDGTTINRWRGEGSAREATVDAYLAGEEPDGRWS